MELVPDDRILAAYYHTVFSGVSLTVLTAIGLDRLLALTLKFRYRQIVTVKRARWAVLVFWIKSGMIGALHLASQTLLFTVGAVLILLDVLISRLFIHKNIFCYPKTISASSIFSPNREQYTKYGTLQTVSFQRIMGSFDFGDLLHTFCRSNRCHRCSWIKHAPHYGPVLNTFFSLHELLAKSRDLLLED